MLSPSCPVQNPYLKGLVCIREPSAHTFSIGSLTGDNGLGCPTCLAAGLPTSLRLEYEDDPKFAYNSTCHGVAGFGHRLPYTEGFPTLGEGGTPLLDIPAMAAHFGISRVLLKMESGNPTGSHKDRATPQGIARAMVLRRNTVVCASGNAGISVAAYAAAAGLQCKVISTENISLPFREALDCYGAELVIVANDADRWPRMRRMVEDEGCYPITNFLTPPIGSSPWSLQGYQTLSWELLEQNKREIPDMVIVPGSRGDLFYGIWQGFVRAKAAGMIAKLPRMIAIEPAVRLESALKGGDHRREYQGPPHQMFSIAGSTVAYQSLLTLEQSGGYALTVTQAEARQARRTLGSCGVFAEYSSAAAFAGLAKLHERGGLQPHDKVVLIITSHGFKDARV
jgi:threonine synthase